MSHPPPRVAAILHDIAQHKEPDTRAANMLAETRYVNQKLDRLEEQVKALREDVTEMRAMLAGAWETR